VITRQQLLAFGFSDEAIKHRAKMGRLHPVWRGVYAVGRPISTREGRWMAAILACDPRSGLDTDAARRAAGAGRAPGTAFLSHGSAAALLGIGHESSGFIEVSTRSRMDLRRPEVRVHRRSGLRDEDVGFFERIPVTSPAQTILDMAARLPRIEVERMVDEADRLDLIHPPALRAALADHPRQPGLARLRTWLDRRTFRLTRSKLERWFLPLAARAGLPAPETKAWVNGFEVDFHWPGLRLVVETDSLRHHRTPAQQSRDHERDQAHTAADCTCLRFSHEQIRYEPEHVLATLRPVARRLLAGAEPGGAPRAP
jgi:very-short-patch-repair endonuclease